LDGFKIFDVNITCAVSTLSGCVAVIRAILYGLAVLFVAGIISANIMAIPGASLKILSPLAYPISTHLLTIRAPILRRFPAFTLTEAIVVATAVVGAVFRSFMAPGVFLADTVLVATIRI
jgi:hypothetical protein